MNILQKLRRQALRGERKRGGTAPRKRRALVLLPLCAALAAAGPVLSVWDRKPANPKGLFSWNADMVNSTDGALFSVMETQGLNTLYQRFSSDNSRHEQMASFAEQAQDAGVTLYHLAGDASWALDPKGEKICAAIEDAAAYNRRIERKFRKKYENDPQIRQVPRITGIMLDIEPYTLKEWDRDAAAVMDSFIKGMSNAYRLARQQRLSVILCIPWHYDNKGMSEQLEALVANCCDGIAVMNYYRGTEIENIATEAELARRFGKELITIYELQEADGSGIGEVNTYHDAGLDALWKNFESIEQAYRGQKISVALHDYKALKEVLEKT